MSAFVITVDFVLKPGAMAAFRKLIDWHGDAKHLRLPKKSYSPPQRNSGKGKPQLEV